MVYQTHESVIYGTYSDMCLKRQFLEFQIIELM